MHNQEVICETQCIVFINSAQLAYSPLLYWTCWRLRALKWMKSGSSVYEWAVLVSGFHRVYQFCAAFRIKGLEGNVLLENTDYRPKLHVCHLPEETHILGDGYTSKLEGGSQGDSGLLPTYSNTVIIYAIQSKKKKEAKQMMKNSFTLLKCWSFH